MSSGVNLMSVVEKVLFKYMLITKIVQICTCRSKNGQGQLTIRLEKNMTIIIGNCLRTVLK